jgi:hypothetical protein
MSSCPSLNPSYKGNKVKALENSWPFQINHSAVPAIEEICKFVLEMLALIMNGGN